MVGDAACLCMFCVDREVYEVGGQDDPVRHSETLAEEFLSLLIILLSK